MHHSIRPLMLDRMKMNKSLMTYLMNFYEEIWVCQGIHRGPRQYKKNLACLDTGGSHG